MVSAVSNRRGDICRALFFSFAGTYLFCFMFLISMGGAPIVLLCAALWVFAAPLWVWRADSAAGFYLPLWPLLAWFTFMLHSLFLNVREAVPRKAQLFDYAAGSAYIFTVLLILGALAVLVMQFRRRQSWRLLPFAISVMILLTAFGVRSRYDRTTQLATHEMRWTTNVDQFTAVPASRLPVRALMGTPLMPQAAGQAAIILYRKVGNGYCVQTVFSNRLRDRLVASRKDEVPVVYTLLMSYGQYRGYTLRSVDGYLMADEHRVYDGGEAASTSIGNLPKGTDCQR